MKLALKYIALAVCVLAITVIFTINMQYDKTSIHQLDLNHRHSPVEDLSMAEDPDPLYSVGESPTM